MQLFNEINSRKIRDEYNVFEGMFHSHIFSLVLIITAGFQVCSLCWCGAESGAVANSACQENPIAPVASSSSSCFVAHHFLINTCPIHATPQVIIMFFLTGVFKTTRLNGYEWLFSVLIGSTSLVVSFVIKYVSRCGALLVGTLGPSSIWVVMTATESPQTASSDFPACPFTAQELAAREDAKGRAEGAP